jgi:hypothetical protein
MRIASCIQSSLARGSGGRDEEEEPRRRRRRRREASPASIIAALIMRWAGWRKKMGDTSPGDIW